MATNGLVVMTPTSIAYSGTSASINADGSVSFSAVTSLSLNGVFTGDYDNYMVTLRNSIGTSSSIDLFRFRTAGVDETSASYTQQALNTYGSTIVGARSSGRSNIVINYGYNISRNGFTCYLYGPYLSSASALRNVTVYDESGAGLYNVAGTCSATSQHDGFTVSGTSNITGLLTVFGFNQ